MIAEIGTSAMQPTMTHKRLRASIGRRNVAAIAWALPLAKLTDRRVRHGPPAKRSLSDGLDAFDHVLIFRAILVPHRFDGVLERRLVGNLDDLAAGRLRLLHRLLLVSLPEFAFLELCFAGKFLEEILIVGRKVAPRPLGE